MYDIFIIKIRRSWDSPSVRPSEDKIVSALYLPQYLPDSFHIWIFGNFLEFVTLTLSCYDMGSDMNPKYGVIMGGVGILRTQAF